MKKIMALILSISLVCSISVTAFAAGSGVMAQNQTQDSSQGSTQDEAQTQTQSQDRVQSEVNAQEQEQAKLQVRDRLQITDQAKIQQQDRLQMQDQTQSGFADTEQHWAREQVGAAYSWGLINGYPNGEFNPDGSISGTEGVLMMSRLLNCLNIENTDGDTVEDAEVGIDLEVVPEWAREQLQEGTALQIAQQSQCYGESQLNRLQFAVMLAKAMGVETADVSEDTVVFLDQEDIPQEFLGYIDALRTLGIIEGSDGCFCADQTVTRAQAAAMLTRVLDMLA